MPGASAAEDQFRMSDSELLSQPTIYADGLLRDQVALVSGGGSGLGRAIAWLLARLGAEVVVSGRTMEKLAAVVEPLRAHGLKAHAAVADIRDPAAVAGLFGNVWSDRKRLDILVNSAGGQFPKSAIDITPNGWNAVVNTNLTGTWYMMQEAAVRWRDAGGSGAIVNIIAVVNHGLYGLSHSVAARSGVIGISNQMAVEWAPYGIRVNCLAPGPIVTEGWAHHTPEARARFDKSNPMMRVGTPWEVAEAVAYLAGPGAGFVNGALLTIDGGGQHWGEIWAAGKPEYFAAASRVRDTTADADA